MGIYEKALDAEDDWYQRMAKVKELGFDFMEISIDETDERLSRIYAGDEEIYRIQDAAHKAGVFIQSLCLSVHRRFRLEARIRLPAQRLRRLWRKRWFLRISWASA